MVGQRTRRGRGWSQSRCTRRSVEHSGCSWFRLHRRGPTTIQTTHDGLACVPGGRGDGLIRRATLHTLTLSGGQRELVAGSTGLSIVPQDGNENEA
ncbi:unnamed protein product, partial [Clonostachys rhizophaga]